MDIARPSNKAQKRRRRLVAGGAALVLVLLIVLGLSRLAPAAPAVDRATLWIETVQRGPMVREVRGPGTLVPEVIRWVPATTSGRVERILMQPGREVESGSLVLELSNPVLEQQLVDAGLALRAAEAALTSFAVQLETEYLEKQAAAATIEAEYKKAAMQLDVDRKLSAQGLVSSLVVEQKQLDADQLKTRHEIARAQLASSVRSSDARLAVQQTQVDQARALLRLKEREVADLHVRAGMRGVLQLVPVEVGQQVAPGTNLARVADPSGLRAELRIAETQAKDVRIDQRAAIDTFNGVIPGRVVRINPSVTDGTVTVDVALTGDLPVGARPDLTVDGVIEIERLNQVLFVGRPSLGQENRTMGLFRLDEDGGARRVQVMLGRSSVKNIEIVSGLSAGEEVILSDMSAWEEVDRIRLE